MIIMVYVWPTYTTEWQRRWPNQHPFVGRFYLVIEATLGAVGFGLPEVAKILVPVEGILLDEL